MREKAIAVVVTYNRKALLVQTLAALERQTRKLSGIILVDNASTDGTAEALRAEGWLERTNIEYVRMPVNGGGAGGFHEGMKRAMQAGADWIWVMDDDGRPHEMCLEKFLLGDGEVRGPIVISDSDHSRSAFPYHIDGSWIREIDTILSAEKIVPVHPFNGVLFSRELVSRIGLPDSEFFLWGDELDYRERWQAAGYAERVIRDAYFFHPEDRQVVYRSHRRSIGVPVRCSALRRYCYYRNQVYLMARRSGRAKTLLKIVISVGDVLIKDPQPWLFAQACFHALTGNRTHHQRLLL